MWAPARAKPCVQSNRLILCDGAESILCSCNRARPHSAAAHRTQYHEGKSRRRGSLAHSLGLRDCYRSIAHCASHTPPQRATASSVVIVHRICHLRFRGSYPSSHISGRGAAASFTRRARIEDRKSFVSKMAARSKGGAKSQRLQLCRRLSQARRRYSTKPLTVKMQMILLEASLRRQLSCDPLALRIGRLFKGSDIQ